MLLFLTTPPSSFQPSPPFPLSLSSVSFTFNGKGGDRVAPNRATFSRETRQCALCHVRAVESSHSALNFFRRFIPSPSRHPFPSIPSALFGLSVFGLPLFGLSVFGLPPPISSLFHSPPLDPFEIRNIPFNPSPVPSQSRICLCYCILSIRALTLATSIPFQLPQPKIHSK